LYQAPAAFAIEGKATATPAARPLALLDALPISGASYPAHTHAGEEELHLLDGELWIDERKLFPGDYNYGAPGARDERVCSGTGCDWMIIRLNSGHVRCWFAGCG